jgi:hypothetical protein
MCHSPRWQRTARVLRDGPVGVRHCRVQCDPVRRHTHKVVLKRTQAGFSHAPTEISLDGGRQVKVSSRPQPQWDQTSVSDISLSPAWSVMIVFLSRIALR